MSDRFDDVGIAWRSLAELLTELLEEAPEGVTIDVMDDRFGEEGPYIQVIQQEDDTSEEWIRLVEASGTDFTSLPTPPDTYTTPGELGYTPPDDENPNHHQILSAASVALKDPANLMAAITFDDIGLRFRFN